MGCRASLLEMYLMRSKQKGECRVIRLHGLDCWIPEADVALQLPHAELAGRCNGGLAKEEPGA